MNDSVNYLKHDFNFQKLRWRWKFYFGFVIKELKLIILSNWTQRVRNMYIKGACLYNLETTSQLINTKNALIWLNQKVLYGMKLLNIGHYIPSVE